MKGTARTIACLILTLAPAAAATDGPDVPAFATGHATIFQWRCEAGHPVITRRVLEVDAQGFPIAFWHRVTR